MREVANIAEVASLDADYLGFVFYPDSPRYVSLDGESIEVIRDCKKQTVGVFVNEKANKMLAKADLLRLDALQLHGNESPALCRVLRKAGYSIIKVFSIASTDDFKQIEQYAGCCDYFLFDTKCAGYGGSCKRFDWSLLDEYRGYTPFLLSGGLTPDCVPEIKRLKHPQFTGIDLNSGFEKSPALKDIGKLAKFMTEIRLFNKTDGWFSEATYKESLACKSE